MATRKPKAPTSKAQAQTGAYIHTESKAIIRPEIGVQTYAAAQGKFKRGPAKYRYDDSLAPELAWDSQNPAREHAEALIARLGEIQQLLQQCERTSNAPSTSEAHLAEEDRLQVAQTLERARLLRELEVTVKALQALSQPFLNWSGKAERLSFEVPTLPLFIHERLSTEAILETLKSHRASGQVDWLNDLFGNPERPVWEQLTKSYEHANGWSNRMILGDSLVVMNSLLQFERMAGEVQMIYIDPPYGVKFGSNFQPFVRKRDVANNDDVSLTREPEMVKAYRDTWELGLHSYLTYLRDRLLLARDLLVNSGSIFVQISDENLHHVREVMDEVFGAENCVATIAFKKTGFASSEALSTTHDYLVWFAKDRSSARIHPVFGERPLTPDELAFYDQIELPSGQRRALSKEEKALGAGIRELGRPFARNPMVSPGWQDSLGYEIKFEGNRYRPPANRHWATSEEGMERLRSANRLAVKGNTLRFVRYFDDFALQPLGTVWDDTGVGGFVGDERLYVVQTDTRVIERCMLMTTAPGDLVLDPTCGSGTTAYVAEQWGRRWITMDTSRVPLALARQRLLTATFPFHELKDPARGPAGGFKYLRKQNNKGEEVGGIVPHITLKSIANSEPPDFEVLVDRPEQVKSITRLTGRFVVEATIPTPQRLEGDGSDSNAVSPAEDDWSARMIGILRASPLLHVGGGRTVKLASIREPSQALTLSAEAVALNDSLAGSPHPNPLPAGEEAKPGAAADTGNPVAILFGPENGALTEATVRSAHDEASMKSRGYAHMYVIGFAIDPRAREYLEHAAQLGVAATYVQATPDVLMGDLLKNMRSSQIFSVCGLPDVALDRVSAPADALGAAKEFPYFSVRLDGLDVFDPARQEVDHRSGLDVPCWLLDTDYNGMVFHVNQAFFPRTAAWDNLKRSLKAEFDENVWSHLSGNVSAPFTLGRHGKIAVKVIDDRGNELMVVKEVTA